MDFPTPRSGAKRSLALLVTVGLLGVGHVASSGPASAAPRYSALAGTTVGSTSFAVPAGAIVVSPSGNDAAAGTAAAPYRTLAHAISKATTGKTIVLRAGTYHETVVVPDAKRLTIQSWPKEAVWLDGSRVVSGWVADGGGWRVDGWTVEFDKSPTFTRGAPDNPEVNWTFVDPKHPMAAHPDQIWIDGVAQRQVGSRAEVTAGTFFHDEVANRLHLGSDPRGRTVRVSALQVAMRFHGPGSVLRGIGITRYAPSVPDMGTVVVDRASNMTIEHVSVTDISTRGVSVHAPNATLRNVHVARAGMLGIGASRADGLVVDRVVSERNNVERFNTAPVAGGMKFGRTRGITVRDSIARDNHGTGLWLDESTVDSVLTGNELRGNQSHGIALELSSKVLVANNIMTGNAGWGLKINNTDTTDVWNNTFARNGSTIWLVQDARVPNPAGDARQPFPELKLTWRIGPATFANNVLANQTGTDRALLTVQDPTGARTAEQIGVTTDGNVYNRPSTSAPKRLVTWSRGAQTPSHHTSLAAFRTATGQERSGHQVDGPAVVDANGLPLSAMPAATSARPLPTAVANRVGQPSGARHLGAWPRQTAVAATAPAPVPTTVGPASAPAPAPTTTAPAPAPTPTTAPAPAPAGPLGTDAFSRTVKVGWGTANLGAWTVSSGSNFAVDRGTGRITGDKAGATRTATLDGVSRADVDLRASLALNVPATGSGTYVSLIGRRVSSGNEYRAVTRFLPSGEVAVNLVRFRDGAQTVLGSAVVPGTTYSPGQVLKVRFQLRGEQLRAKVWRNRTAEPSAWLVEATDATPALQGPGTVGIAQYLSSSSTRLPVVLYVDDLRVGA